MTELCWWYRVYREANLNYTEKVGKFGSVRMYRTFNTGPGTATSERRPWLA
jgi:hypothetical protein